jgi:hypothetical protein
LDRVHVALDCRKLLVFRNFQIVLGLQVEPELRARFEVTSQSQSGVGRSATMSAMRVTGTRRSSASLFMLRR